MSQHCAKDVQAWCNLTPATIVLDRYGYSIFVWSNLGQECLGTCTLATGWETQSPLPARGWARIQTQPVLLKPWASQISSFYPKSHSERPSTWGSAVPWRSYVWKGGWEWIPWAMLSKTFPRQPTLLWCISHTLFAGPLSADSSIDSALGSLCPGCPLHPFCWYIPRMFKFTPALQPGLLSLRTGCERLPWCSWASAGQDCAGPRAPGFPLPCPWGLGTFYLLSSCSFHRP